MEHLGAALVPGNLQHIVDQRGQAAHFVDNHLHIFRRGFPRQIPDHFAVAGDHGQRGAQVVGNIGDQIFLHLVQLGKLIGGSVQGGGKLFRFPAVAPVEIDVVIAHGQLHGFFAHPGQRTGKPGRQNQGESHRQQGQQHRQQDHLQLQGGHSGGQRLDFRGQQGKIPGFSDGVQLYMQNAAGVVGVIRGRFGGIFLSAGERILKE